MWKYLRNLWWNPQSLWDLCWLAIKIGLAMLGIMMGMVVLVIFIPELKGGILGDIAEYFLVIAIIGGSITTVSALRGIAMISQPEKAKQKTVSLFSDKEARIRLKIEAENNAAEKERLEQTILELRKEYESFLSTNLRRKDGTFVSDWREVLLVTRGRLLDEEDRLLTRNVANMQSGILMAFLGVAFPLSYLIYVFYGIIFSAGKESSNIDLSFTTYLPIVSIVFIFEVIAFFFLSLYSSNERRIERNKSDLTNIDLRLTSGLMLYDEENKRNFAILAKILAQEDSKFVLGKNETTGGISTNKLLETLLKITPTGGG